MVHRADGVGGGIDGDLDRILEVVPDQVADIAVERRREQHRLGPARAVAQDPLDLRREPVVGHAVGLVEHDDVDVGPARSRPTSAGRSGAAAWPPRSRRPRLQRRRPGAGGWPRRTPAGSRWPAWAATGSSTSATCTASSRVGTSTSPSGRDGSASSVMRASIGTPKASVLPDPVRARPQTSRPCMATRDRFGLDRERLGEPGGGEAVVDARRYAEVGEAGGRLDRRAAR